MAIIFSLLLLLFNTFNIYGDQTYTGINWRTDSVLVNKNLLFYWDKYIPVVGDVNTPDDLVSLPFDWSKNPKYSTRGKGSFKTSLFFERDNVDLGIKMSNNIDSYTLFVNGELIGQNYMEGNERLGTGIFRLPDSNELDLVIYISNYNDLHGGIASPPIISSFDLLMKKQHRTIIFEAFLFGALFFTGLLYLSFYLTKKEEMSALFFGIFSIVISFRTILYGEHIILYFFPYLSMEAEATFGHLTFYLAVPLFISFLASEYTFNRSRWVVGLTYIISAVYVVFAIIFKHLILNTLLIYYQVLTLVVGGISSVVLIKRAINLNYKAVVTSTGFLVLLFATVNDILLAQEVISTIHMTPIGMLIFIISQGVLLTQSIAKSLTKSEQLAQELTLVNKSFKRFVPEEFLNILGKKRIFDIRQGDHVQLNMTIMFCDIRDFTMLSEKMSPGENFQFINSFLERVGPVIRNNGGFIDKYMGDGFMSLFPAGADTAINAALDIQKTLKLYNSHRNNSGYKCIKLGIGINTGSLMLGTIGENERMDGTVISDAVNICSRIESITKEYGINIAISEKTYSNLYNKKNLDIRNIGCIYLRGKVKPVSVYEVFNMDSDEIRILKIKYKDNFEKAVKLYEKGSFNEALKIFEDIIDKFPNDLTIAAYLGKIKSYGNEASYLTFSDKNSIN